MLSAAEAQKGMAAHLKYCEDKGMEPKFSLCIYVDKGRRESGWLGQDGKPLPHSKDDWRNRWHTWRIGK